MQAENKYSTAVCESYKNQNPKMKGYQFDSKKKTRKEKKPKTSMLSKKQLKLGKK